MYTSIKTAFKVYKISSFNRNIASWTPLYKILTYNVHLSRHKGTKAAIQVYKTLQTSKEDNAHHYTFMCFCRLQYLFWNIEGGNPLFGWRLPKAHKGVGRRHGDPRLAKGSPPNGGSALVENLPGPNGYPRTRFIQFLTGAEGGRLSIVLRSIWSRQYASESSTVLSQCDARISDGGL